MIIPIECIHQNPLNPRKELGDLTELTASIKTNGVFQNLVVLENEAGKDYTLIMGHRRYAAAVEAGLEELPCNVVRNISEADQVTMMLSENMQRNNLTKYEETAGIQQALDLGLSESDVADRTGFSKATISKHRKAMELGSENVKKYYSKGATIEELLKLMNIKDSKEREIIGGAAGTDSFDWSYNKAIKEQEWKPKKDAIIKVLEDKFKAKEEKNQIWGEGKEIKSVDGIKVPKKVVDKYTYYASKYDACIYLYDKTKINAKKKSDKPKLTEAQVKKQEKENQRKASYATAYSCRIAFYRSLMKQKLKLNDKFVYAFNKFVFDGDTYYRNAKIIEEITGLKEDEISESKLEINKMMMVNAVCQFEQKDIELWTSYEGKYNSEDDRANHLYELLDLLDYPMSSTEKAMRDGSWELFEK